MTRSAAPLGTLYGLGLGPGDPELVTLKALRVMQRVSTLALPVRRAGDLGYAWSIAAPHLEPGQQRVLRLPFSEHRDSPDLDAQWDRGCTELLRILEAGQDAAFLTEGDPLLYSTFIHLVAALRRANPALPVEIVPGVSSVTAAAAAAGEPLVSRAGRLAVLPAIYGLDELRATLHDFDTVVLMKVHRVLDQVVALLREPGLERQAFLVERCGRPEQRVVRDLGELASGGLDYFSILVLRKPETGVSLDDR
jgi:precorrin-2/cobalt-factor-2 C20-methyltransferase